LAFYLFAMQCITPHAARAFANPPPPLYSLLLSLLIATSIGRTRPLKSGEKSGAGGSVAVVF
jgi:hypothetical protein